jgi:hypothetical protein
MEYNEFITQIDTIEKGVNTTALVVFNRDLNKENRKLSISDIEWTHLGISHKSFCKENIVMYVDTDGNTKILKNRYGNKGVVK